MITLPENIEDFNTKYRETIAVIDYTVRIQARKQRIVGALHRVRDGHLELSYIAQNAKHKPYWESRTIMLDSIESFSTPIPELGYIAPDGHYPVYISKAATKNYRRGYNPNSIMASTPNIIQKMAAMVDIGHVDVRRMDEAPLVQALFDPDFKRYKKLTSVRKKLDYFAVLSKDFMGINDGESWLLLYQNNIIGSLFPLQIDPSIKGLEDVFHSQVMAVV